MALGVFQIAALALAGTGAVVQGVAAKKQRDSQKLQRGMAEQEAKRSMLQQIREARIARAQVEQAAATQGTGGSSSALGGQSVIGTSAAMNIGAINMGASAQQSMFDNAMGASRFSDLASGLTSLANIAGGMPTSSTPKAPASASGSGYGVQGGMSGVNSSHVVTNPLTNPLPKVKFG